MWYKEKYFFVVQKKPNNITYTVDTTDWRTYAVSCNCKSVFVHLPMRNNSCPSQNLTHYEARETPGITVQ